MSNRSPDDLTRSEVKQRNPIGMDYRADHAEHKFPGARSAGFDCHSSSLTFCSSTGEKMGRAHSPRKAPSFIKQELAHFSNDQPFVYDEHAVISVMRFDDPRVLHV
jgi:hypothetical protein